MCGLVLGAVEARMPLRSPRMDSEGLTGLGWHWSTPRSSAWGSRSQDAPEKP
nr:MAG TPA: hypothetical protein [Caudoviricetes sp.]